MTAIKHEPGTVYYVRHGVAGAFYRSPLDGAPVVFSNAEIARYFIRLVGDPDLRIFPALGPIC